jgi:hypothetical protein
MLQYRIKAVSGVAWLDLDGRGCYTDSVSKSSESKLSSKEELTCACSSSQTGGRIKVSTCSY